MTLPEGWEMVVGLEVHTELLTRTKLFCGCENAFGAEPNTRVCPVCLGLPGSLPVVNARAVELAIAIGLALHSTVSASTFHRKNYFYPDMPKDYQISQYDQPINAGGYLDLPDGSRVGVERAHLEEDTGKSTHLGGSGRIHGAERSLVDYNRAGVPLVEIVSAPDIRSSAQARAYAAELRAILVAAGASDGRMEEGSMRIDANVSVHRVGEPFGTRCEMKNLNSLRSLQRAIDFEADRQYALIAAGGTVRQETRHWDEDRGVTELMRTKEEADDYRYFQEPDLVELDPGDEWIERVDRGLAPMPAARRAALRGLVVEPSEAQLAAIDTVVDLDVDDFVAAAVAAGVEVDRALARAANELADGPATRASLTADGFATTLLLEQSGELSATQAKGVLEALGRSGGDPHDVARALGYEKMDTGALEELVDTMIVEHESEWRRFVEGDEKLAQFFTGQVMRATRGQADGKAVLEVLHSRKEAGAS
jgi:aspartyl-tRNA(Asn)/glutamyl-tRNA(Gln) amidotransferase subunit B